MLNEKYMESFDMMWNDLDEKRVGEKCGIFGMWLKIIPKVN